MDESAEYKRMLRLRYIADDIVKGKSKREICKRFEEEWNVSHKLMCCLYNEALATLTDDESLEKLREINSARLLEIYNKACESGDVRTQLRAIDLLNKTNSVYTTKIEAGENTEFVFNFSS